MPVIVMCPFVNKREFTRSFIFVLFVGILLYAGIFYLKGFNTLLDHNKYDQHTRQAKAWLSGKINLDENPAFLELATYNERVYVSFPPTPTVIELPFVALLGADTPNTLVLVVMSWLAFISMFLILFHFSNSGVFSIITALSFFVGTNVFQNTLTASVWSQGQIMGLCFALYAIVLSIWSSPGLFRVWAACLCMGLAVGCRPFYVFFIPIIIIFVLRLKYPRWKIYFSIITGLLLIAVPLAIYNTIRFGNPIEFGHSYLPHSLQLEHGLFSIKYFITNVFHTFLKMPDWDFELKIMRFNGRGTAFWLTAPIYVVSLFYIGIKEKNLVLKIALLFSLGMTWIGLLLHESNGWYQYGYRYGIDLLPTFLLMFCLSFHSMSRLLYGVLFWGIALNFYCIWLLEKGL
jgi:hypothetical protein